MSGWDPWKRYWREQERRMWDPLYRYEYERERMSWDPYYRMERELTDPFYRLEKQRERELYDPLYRYEKEQERFREDLWYRELHRMKNGLRIDQVADPMYIQEKETGLGTRPADYMNPEYRVGIDNIKEDIPVRKADVDFDKFFDPNWLTSEEIEQQLKELEEKERRRNLEVATMNRKSSGLLGFLKRLFWFL